MTTLRAKHRQGKRQKSRLPKKPNKQITGGKSMDNCVNIKNEIQVWTASTGLITVDDITAGLAVARGLKNARLTVTFTHYSHPEVGVAHCERYDCTEYAIRNGKLTLYERWGFIGGHNGKFNMWSTQKY
jgi:hypothetical protein